MKGYTPQKGCGCLKQDVSRLPAESSKSRVLSPPLGTAYTGGGQSLACRSDLASGAVIQPLG